MAARPGLRALLRLLRPARPTSSCPALVHDNHHDRPARHATRTATTSPRTSPTTPSASSRTSATSTPTSRCSSTSPPAPATRRTRRPPDWIERYRGRFDGGWDAWREATLARQKAAGVLPRRHRAVAPARLGAGVGRRCRPTSAASTPATWRRSPATCRTPTHQIGRLVDRLEPMRRARRHGDRACCPTTARQSEGGPTGSLNDVRVWNGVPRTVEEARRAASTRSAGRGCHNNYPWGWTVAGNTPFRRWKRETHEGGVADPLIVHWPRRHRRRGARCAASTSTPSTSCRPCSTLIGIDAARQRSAASPSGRSTA